MNTVTTFKTLLKATAIVGLLVGPQLVATLTEPFRRGTARIRSDQAGVGLGLAIVYGIVQRHEGCIDVESAVGQGTTFRIYLPVLSQAPEAAPQDAPKAKRSLHILVVDDDPMVRDVIVEYLQYEAHSIATAGDGVEGWEKFRTGHFDLVITDRAMPKLNGDGLAAAVKEQQVGTPVILLTGFGEFMNASGELPKGVDYVMSKPFTLNVLRQAIAYVTGTPS